ncbi:hypothetical protein KH5H1_58360 [Corallococcus caeni]|nr:hypothetical protein KH5H1_58360 [Corallococcus sp. KH5-1]
MHPLKGLSVLHREGGAQGFVAGDDELQGAAQRLHVQRAVQPQRGGDVVVTAARTELLHHPQPLLREGQRQIPVPRRGDERRDARARDAREELHLHPLREPGDGGRIEEGAQRQLHPEGRTQPGDELRGQQGVTPDDEEVVMQPHRLQAEQLLEQRGDALLEEGHPLRSHGPAGDRARIRRGQGLAVHLADGRERQRVQRHERGGHQRRGQPFGDEGAQLRRFHRSARHVPRHEAIRVHPGHRCLHRRVLPEDGLHLAQLNAEAAQLHLRVHAAQEVQRPIRQPPHAVARAVQPSPRHVAKR